MPHPSSVRTCFSKTVTPEGEKTTVYLEWNSFEDAQYLDDVEILVETEKASEPSGTQLTMNGDDELLAEWDQQRFDKLQFELRKLKSPMNITISEDEFRIDLIVEGFSEVSDIKDTIEPYILFSISLTTRYQVASIPKVKVY